MQSIVEDYAGYPQDAERYALDGLRHTGSGSPQRALLLADSIAGVRATFGDLPGVDKAVGEAREIVDGLSPAERGPIRRTNVDNLTTYHPATMATVASLSYARLGKPDRVQEVVSDIAPMVEAEGTDKRSYLRMDQALAVMRSDKPDVDRVATLTTQGLALATPFQTAHVGKRLDAILVAAAPLRNHPAIVDLTENARVWRTNRTVAARPELST
jgi:hypothetical protein